MDRIEAPNLITWLVNEMKSWEDSYNSFTNSSRVITRIQPDRERYNLPSWDEVIQILPEVFSRTKLRVVNSDDLSKDLNFLQEQMLTEVGNYPKICTA